MPAEDRSFTSVAEPTEDTWLRLLKEVADSAPVLAPPASESITGTIKNRNGDPMPGVEVTLMPLMPGVQASDRFALDPDQPEFWQTVAEAARQAVRHYTVPFANRVVVVTGADGTFAASGLLQTRYSAQASLTGYRFSSSQQTSMLRPGDTVDWVGWRPISVDVQVDPPSNVDSPQIFVVWRVDGRGSRSEAIVGGSKKLELPAGKYGFRVEERTSGLASDFQEVELIEGSPESILKFEWKMPPAIVVSVAAGDARPFRGITVMLAKHRADLSEAQHFDGERRLFKQLALSNRQQVWASGEVEPGNYIVGVRNGGHLVETRMVVVESGPTECRFDLPVTSDLGVVCTVHGLPANEYPDGYTLWGRTSAGREGQATPSSIWTLPGNRQLLLFDPRPDEIEEFRTVVCWVRKLGTLRKTGSFRKGSAIEFEFQQGQQLTLRVQGVPPALRSDLGCILKCEENGVVGIGGLRDTIDGVLTVDGGIQQPGQYQITLIGRTRIMTPPLVRKEIELKAGKDLVVELSLPDLYEVTVKADPIKTQAWIAFHWEGQDLNAGEVAMFTLGREGSCILTCIPAGTYSITYDLQSDRSAPNAPRRRVREFTVSGHMTLNLTE